MKKIFILSFLAATIVLGGVVVGTSTSGSDKNEAVIENNTILDDSINTDLEEIEKEEELIDNDESSEDIEEENYDVPLVIAEDVSFEKNSTTIHPVFNTQWKTNDAGNSICIEGRGEDAIEEGEGIIYLKNNGNMYQIKFNSSDDKYTPVYLEWIDDTSFIVKTGTKHGTIRTGGTIYKINIDDLIPYVVYELKENEELTDTFQIDDDTLNIKLKSDGSGARTYSIDNNITVILN